MESLNQKTSIRSGQPDDLPDLIDLYRLVAADPGGIIRDPQEITKTYVSGFLTQALKQGLVLVAVIGSFCFRLLAPDGHGSVGVCVPLLAYQRYVSWS